MPSKIQPESRWQAVTSFHVGILLGIFFDTEDGDKMFLLNVG
jgi:hypothetical protein